MNITDCSIEKEDKVIQEEKSMEISENNGLLNDKIKIELELYHLCDEKDESIPLVNKNFTYNIRGNLLHKLYGYNKLIIPNFLLKGGTLSSEVKKGSISGESETPISSNPYP